MSTGTMVRNYKRKTSDKWSKDDLLAALRCIKEGLMKINDASRHFGISRATLYRQYQKYLDAGGNCGVNQLRTCGGNAILSSVEEDVLVKTILDLRANGFPVDSSDVKKICYAYCEATGVPNQFTKERRMASDDWYYGFLKRHEKIKALRNQKPMTFFSVTSTGKIIKQKKTVRKPKPSTNKANTPLAQTPSTSTSISNTGTKEEPPVSKVKMEDFKFDPDLSYQIYIV